MRRIISLASAAALTAATALAVTAEPAHAVQGQYTYVGAAGGTQINALGTTISSGLTAGSNLTGSEYPAANGSSVAAVSVPNLVKVGAVSTGETADLIPGGEQIASRAQVAGINLLNGLITAQALDTTAYARVVDGVPSGNSDTNLVHLTIGGALIPIDVAPNTTINLGTLAKVVVNESRTEFFANDAIVRVKGSALHVTLLKAYGGAPAGAEIWVNPVVSLMLPTIQSEARPVGGYAFGLTATVQVGSTVNALVQPVGQLTVPSYGTGGATITNRALGVSVPNIAAVKAVTTSMNAYTDATVSEVTTTSELAGVSLLNNLIQANALQVSSHQFRAGEVVDNTARINFVSLTIAGKPIKVNVAKNTTINVLGIAKVVINAQAFTPEGNSIDALKITLLKPSGKLPIGAIIRVSAAASYVY